MQQKTCFNCSAEFACGSKEAKCWCMAYVPLTKLDEAKDCLCETCLKAIQAETQSSKPSVEQEADYYIENGFYVFTSSYHLKRGFCCKNGCRHCPYGYKNNMNNIPKAVFCWSGGKDSSYCLHKVLSEKQFDVVYLMTTVNDTFKRISMHGVREELLDKQIEAIGIHAIKIRIQDGTHAEYEQLMRDALLQVKTEGVTHVIFGDIFLADLRMYREENLKKVDLIGVFPLWEMNTKDLIQDFITKEFKTITCCINDGYFDETWVGKKIDADFIKELPDFVDPCGENGEYHTFCYDGPVFNKPIAFTVGEKIYKPLEYTFDDDVCKSPVKTKGFWYCDLIPV